MRSLRSRFERTAGGRAFCGRLLLTASLSVASQSAWGQEVSSKPEALHRIVRELSAQPTEERGAYLRSSLQKLGVPYRVQSFDTVMVSGRDSLRVRGANLIVRFGSRAPVTVVGGHLDAVPGSPGANDNAAAVAVMLGLIGEWRSSGTPGTVECVFFDREENGLIGSEVYARTVDRATHRAMLNLDVVGNGSEIYLGPVGGGDDDRIVPAVRKAADSLGLAVVFSDVYPDSDHDSFARYGLENLSLSVVPAGDAAKLRRMLKEGWSGKREDMPHTLSTIHGPSDVPDLVDPATLGLVLRFVRTVVANLAAP